MSGNTTAVDQQTVNNTFLKNAYEIVGDAIGNEDGLCETGESCIHMPHLGAYTGSGNYTTKNCTFSDGTITGVTVYDYPTD